MRKCENISPYMRTPLVIYDFATAPFWNSLYMRTILFSFLSVYPRLLLSHTPGYIPSSASLLLTLQAYSFLFLSHSRPCSFLFFSSPHPSGLLLPFLLTHQVLFLPLLLFSSLSRLLPPPLITHRAIFLPLLLTFQATSSSSSHLPTLHAYSFLFF